MGLRAWKVTDNITGTVFVVSSTTRGKARMSVLLDAKKAEIRREFCDFNAEAARTYDHLCFSEDEIIGWDDGQFRSGCLAKNNIIERVNE